MDRFSIQPLIPSTLWLIAAIALATMLVWQTLARPLSIARWRWQTICLLQAIGAAAVLLLLLNPTAHRPAPPPPGRPTLTLLVDDSLSMGVTDAGMSRFDAAAHDAASIVEQLRQRFDVDVRRFDARPTSTDASKLATTQPSGDSTDLAAALGETLNRDATAGRALVLLSDGIQNAQANGSFRVLEAAQLARAFDTPIYTRTYGQATDSPDLAMELRATQDLALLHQSIPVGGRIRYRGSAPATTTARLLREDGSEVAARPLAFRAGGDEASVFFSVDAEAVGVHRYRVAIDSIAGEASTENDASPYVLRVVDEPIRALVLEGKPYWDATFLLRTLAADPAIAVDALVQVSDRRVLRRTLSRGASDAGEATQRAETSDILTDPGTVLTSAEMLRPYQVVVIGRDADAFLTPAAVDALRQWISTSGGSLVCYRGDPTSTSIDALTKLLPARWTESTAETRLRLSLTEQGREMRWTLDRASDDPSITQRMPTLESQRSISTQGQPLAIVLAEAADANGRSRPAVVYQPFGAGRVVVIEGSGLWRWSFLPPRFQQRESVYTGLWQSMLRWLASGSGAAPGRHFTLRADKIIFDADERASATLLSQGASTTEPADAPPIELRSSDGAVRQTVASSPAADGSGVRQVDFGRLPPGSYAATINGADETDAGASIAFDVRRFGREMLDLQPRPDLMRRIAEVSGGSVLDERSLADQIAHAVDTRRERAMMAGGDDVTLWDRPWVLTGVLGVWAGAWLLRRRSGLI